MISYKFKVALDFDKRTYRIIEILENQTLEDFHEIIFKAFDRDEEHLYSFYITKKPTKNRRSRYKAPEYTDSEYSEEGFNAAFGSHQYDAKESENHLHNILILIIMTNDKKKLRMMVMEYDFDKIDEMVLSLLYLTVFDQEELKRTWKGHDWNALNRLHENG